MVSSGLQDTLLTLLAMLVLELCWACISCDLSCTRPRGHSIVPRFKVIFKITSSNTRILKEFQNFKKFHVRKNSQKPPLGGPLGSAQPYTRPIMSQPLRLAVEAIVFPSHRVRLSSAIRPVWSRSWSELDVFFALVIPLTTQSFFLILFLLVVVVYASVFCFWSPVWVSVGRMVLL